MKRLFQETADAEHGRELRPETFLAMKEKADAVLAGLLREHRGLRFDFLGHDAWPGQNGSVAVYLYYQISAGRRTACYYVSFEDTDPETYGTAPGVGLRELLAG